MKLIFCGIFGFVIFCVFMVGFGSSELESNQSQHSNSNAQPAANFEFPLVFKRLEAQEMRIRELEKDREECRSLKISYEKSHKELKQEIKTLREEVDELKSENLVSDDVWLLTPPLRGRKGDSGTIPAREQPIEKGQNGPVRPVEQSSKGDQGQQTSDPPQIVKGPKDQKVRVGSIATFFCIVSGDPIPTVHWRKNGKKFGTVHSRIVINTYGGTSMLRIEPTRLERDDAQYSCEAVNGVDVPVSVIASANLAVFAEDELPEGFPVITEPPMTKVVEKGRTTTLNCKATGAPPLKITWLKDLLPLVPTERLSFAGENGEILEIKDVDESDAGGYDCIVENRVGVESSSQSAKVYVKERRVPPEFSLPPDPVYKVLLGADLNLTCVAVGSPMPSVRWRKGIESLTPGDAIPIGKNVLMLKNIRETAVYTCIASSKLGIKETNFTVKVQPLPKPPSTVRVSEVTATSVRLTWSYDKDEHEHEHERDQNVTYYVIQYKPKHSNQDFVEITGVLNQDHIITSLNPYTEYKFIVIAFNNAGRGAPSPAVEATTAETKPTSAPRNLNAKVMSSSRLLVIWDEPESPNGQITGYKVYFTSNSTLPLAQWDAKRVEYDEMTNIHDLIPRTIYTIRVQARTAIGVGPASAPIQIKTEKGLPAQPTG